MTSDDGAADPRLPSPNGRALELAAPAKVNLGLLVGPLRPDGFHEVFSLMVPVTLGDTVKVEPAPGEGLAVECDVAPGEENLAAKMVREMERRLLKSFEVRVTIHKRVPAAAGLGGGSSDAATTLLAVERLFDLDLPERLRYDIAGVVGSDVAFFLWPGPQLVMGRGQVLKDVVVPDPLHVVLAVPDLALSTAEVYAWRDETRLPDLREFAPRTALLTSTLFAASAPRALIPLVVNDLEPVVVARHPVVGELKEAMYGLGAFAAAMSGSGPSVFGLFADEEAARVARGSLASDPRATRGCFYVTDLQPKEQAARRRRTGRAETQSRAPRPRPAHPRQSRDPRRRRPRRQGP